MSEQETLCFYLSISEGKMLSREVQKLLKQRKQARSLKRFVSQVTSAFKRRGVRGVNGVCTTASSEKMLMLRVPVMNINRLKGGRFARRWVKTEAHHVWKRAAVTPSVQNILCSVTHLLLQVLWFRGHLQDPLWLAGGEAAGLPSQQGQWPGHRHGPHCAGENRSGVCSLPRRKQVNASVTLFFFFLCFYFISSPTICLALTQPPRSPASTGAPTQPTVIFWTCASWCFEPLLAVATSWLWVACWPTASGRWRSLSAVMWCWSRGSMPWCAAPSTTGRWTSAVQEAHPHPVGVHKSSKQRFSI